MDSLSQRPVVITGVGLVTPLGTTVDLVGARILAGESVFGAPVEFDASIFACPVCAKIEEFTPETCGAEPKLLRLMNRDAKLAVAAAHAALQDAKLRVSVDYSPEAVALYGATGLAGLPFAEVRGLIQKSANFTGEFDLDQFGTEGLRAIHPLLSFKILSNMPVCFVSIVENIQGPNAVYTPWEGQGAQAIDAGIRAVRSGECSAALVGGCDTKTHALAFIALEQQGLFESWKRSGAGLVPGEGAVYLVLEDEAAARRRGVPMYARIRSGGFATRCPGPGDESVMARAMRASLAAGDGAIQLVSAADGNPALAASENLALALLNRSIGGRIQPKTCGGNLFAAAAALQVALGGLVARQSGSLVMANCFGPGTELAAFLLEPP